MQKQCVAKKSYSINQLRFISWVKNHQLRQKNNFINFQILTADWSRCHALVESALLLWNVQN